MHICFISPQNDSDTSKILESITNKVVCIEILESSLILMTLHREITWFCHDDFSFYLVGSITALLQNRILCLVL